MSDQELSQNAGPQSELYQAGGNQNITKYEIAPVSPSLINTLKTLIEAYKKEIQTADPTTTGKFIEKLNFFMTTVDDEFRTLEEKLETGGFKSDIIVARRLKQRYAMSLQEIKHIQSAQKIHAYTGNGIDAL